MTGRRSGFSLIEVLVVMSTISLLMGILMPALIGARSCAREVVCRSNIRQLVLVNMGYAEDNDGFCVAAASDIDVGKGGYHRWHGVRASFDEPFEPNQGPLAEYLGGGKVKECPTRVDFVEGEEWAESFEKGCGGYGYNMTYIGSRIALESFSREERYRHTARMAEIRQPRETLMFADCAMSRVDNRYIEYSFAEQPHVVTPGKVSQNRFTSPSIHFRHCLARHANVAWSDAHVSAEEMADVGGENVYKVASEEMGLGWFEPVDNSRFDLK